MSDSMCYLLGDPPSTVASYRALALQTLNGGERVIYG